MFFNVFNFWERFFIYGKIFYPTKPAKLLHKRTFK